MFYATNLNAYRDAPFETIRVLACCFWHMLERQVMVTGLSMRRLSTLEIGEVFPQPPARQ